MLQFLHHFARGEPAHRTDAAVLFAGLDPDGRDFAAKRPHTLAGEVNEQTEFPHDHLPGNHARGRQLVFEAAGPVGDQRVPGLGDDPAGGQQRRLRCAQGDLLG